MHVVLIGAGIDSLAVELREYCQARGILVEEKFTSTNSPMLEIALIVKTIVNSQGAAFIGMSDVNKRLNAVIAQLST